MFKLYVLLILSGAFQKVKMFVETRDIGEVFYLLGYNAV
jgi:hypothetical protein